MADIRTDEEIAKALSNKELLDGLVNGLIHESLTYSEGVSLRDEILIRMNRTPI